MQSAELRIGLPVTLDKGPRFMNRYLHGAAVSAPMMIHGELYVLCVWAGSTNSFTYWERVADLQHLTVVDGIFGAAR
jgi:hypothetical protein